MKYLEPLEKLDFNWKNGCIEQLTDLKTKEWKNELSRYQIKENPENLNPQEPNGLRIATYLKELFRDQL